MDGGRDPAHGPDATAQRHGHAPVSAAQGNTDIELAGAHRRRRPRGGVQRPVPGAWQVAPPCFRPRPALRSACSTLPPSSRSGLVWLAVALSPLKADPGTDLLPGHALPSGWRTVAAVAVQAGQESPLGAGMSAGAWQPARGDLARVARKQPEHADRVQRQGVRRPVDRGRLPPDKAQVQHAPAAPLRRRRWPRPGRRTTAADVLGPFAASAAEGSASTLRGTREVPVMQVGGPASAVCQTSWAISGFSSTKPARTVRRRTLGMRARSPKQSCAPLPGVACRPWPGPVPGAWPRPRPGRHPSRRNGLCSNPIRRADRA